MKTRMNVVMMAIAGSLLINGMLAEHASALPSPFNIYKKSYKIVKKQITTWQAKSVDSSCMGDPKIDIKAVLLAAEKKNGNGRITTDQDLTEVNESGTYNPNLALMLCVAVQDSYKRYDESFHDVLINEGFTPAVSNAEVIGKAAAISPITDIIYDDMNGMYAGVSEKKCNGKHVIAIGFRGTEPQLKIDLIDDLDSRKHVFPISYGMKPNVTEKDFIERIIYMEAGFAGYDIASQDIALPDTVDFKNHEFLKGLQFDAWNKTRKDIYKNHQAAYRENYINVYDKKKNIRWPYRSHCGFTTQLLDFMRQEHLIQLSNGTNLYQTLCLAAQKPEDYKIIIYGHSLGGAIAKLYACELAQRNIKPTIYTYGAPACGDAAMVEYYKGKIDLHEFVHPQDLVGSLVTLFDEMIEPLRGVAQKKAGYLTDFPNRNYCTGDADEPFSTGYVKRNGVYGIYYHNEWQYMIQLYRARNIARGKMNDTLMNNFTKLMAIYADNSSVLQKMILSAVVFDGNQKLMNMMEKTMGDLMYAYGIVSPISR